MLSKMVKCLAALSAVFLLAGAGDPCNEPGRLCASPVANTSGDTAAVPTAQAVPAPPAAPLPPPPLRIGLLLPLRSDSLAAPAEALRAGFMAAWETEPGNITVNVIGTGGTEDEARTAYAAAVRQNDVVVGPLARSAVAAIAASKLVTKPTIALNTLSFDTIALPPDLLAIGLSIEDQARRVAAWAGKAHPGAHALVVTGSSSWQRRVAAAYLAQWKAMGLQTSLVELNTADGSVAEASLEELPAIVAARQATVVLAALGSDQARLVRLALGTAMPFYGTSSVNPGATPGMQIEELAGVRFVDLPWLVQPDHPAVMVYPRRLPSGSPLDHERLYALGIDAFRIARLVGREGRGEHTLDGVTGTLTFGLGGAAPHFERTEPAAVYTHGSIEIVPPPP